MTIILLLLSPLACQGPIANIATIPIGDEEYILIFNRVDELLNADLDDAVQLVELKESYSGKEIIGLGTTLREHSGEILFLSGDCYWADPTNNGKVTKLDWALEELPFCAISRVDVEDCLRFTEVEGDVHQWIESRMKELGIRLAAIRIEGTFDEVNLSIAYSLPQEVEGKLENIFVTCDEEDDYGKTKGNDLGGHLQEGNSVDSEVTIFPIDEYILRNRLP